MVHFLNIPVGLEPTSPSFRGWGLDHLGKQNLRMLENVRNVRLDRTLIFADDGSIVASGGLTFTRRPAAVCDFPVKI